MRKGYTSAASPRRKRGATAGVVFALQDSSNGFDSGLTRVEDEVGKNADSIDAGRMARRRVDEFKHTDVEVNAVSSKRHGSWNKIISCDGNLNDLDQVLRRN